MDFKSLRPKIGVDAIIEIRSGDIFQLHERPERHYNYR